MMENAANLREKIVEEAMRLAAEDIAKVEGKPS